MAKKRPAISKGESVVMSAVWRIKQGTLGEIHQEVQTHQAMEYSTVQSYLRRLESKGYVKFRNFGRTRVYRSAVKPETVIGSSVDRMVEQMVSGNAMPVIRHLVQQRGLSQAELQELRELVDSIEPTQPPDTDD